MTRLHPTTRLALEWFFTILPVSLLWLIAFPSLGLLYLLDDSVDACLTIKAIGSQ